MNSVQVFNSPDFSVRTIEDNGEIWFVAKDVAKALGYSENVPASKITQSVPEMWKSRKRVPTLDGVQEMLCLTAQGVIFSLMRSDMKKALPYQVQIASAVVASGQPKSATSQDIKSGELDKPRAKVSENDAADIEMMRANLRGLRKQREALGLTLRQVVELGYTRSRGSLSNLERGVKSFSPEEYNSLAKIFEWELVEEKPLMIFPESMMPIKPDSDCECIPYSGVSVIQTAKDGETRNIWNDDVAIDHMIALREDNTVSKKELAKELGLETERLEYFLKLPLQTKVGLFNRIAEKFGWELYLERQMPIKLPLIVGDSVAEENIKNLEKTRLDQNITLEELSTKTRLSARNYLKPVEKGEIPCSILAYNRIRKVFNWEQYPSRKFMRERKLMMREQKLRHTFGKNYKPGK